MTTEYVDGMPASGRRDRTTLRERFGDFDPTVAGITPIDDAGARSACIASRRTR
jgi:hypothetical protein